MYWNQDYNERLVQESRVFFSIWLWVLLTGYITYRMCFFKSQLCSRSKVEIIRSFETGNVWFSTREWWRFRWRLERGMPERCSATVKVDPYHLPLLVHHHLERKSVMCWKVNTCCLPLLHAYWTLRPFTFVVCTITLKQEWNFSF